MLRHTFYKVCKAQGWRWGLTLRADKEGLTRLSYSALRAQLCSRFGKLGVSWEAKTTCSTGLRSTLRHLPKMNVYMAVWGFVTEFRSALLVMSYWKPPNTETRNWSKSYGQHTWLPVRREKEVPTDPSTQDNHAKWKEADRRVRRARFSFDCEPSLERLSHLSSQHDSIYINFLEEQQQRKVIEKPESGCYGCGKAWGQHRGNMGNLRVMRSVLISTPMESDEYLCVL